MIDMDEIDRQDIHEGGPQIFDSFGNAFEVESVSGDPEVDDDAQVWIVPIEPEARSYSVSEIIEQFRY